MVNFDCPTQTQVLNTSNQSNKRPIKFAILSNHVHHDLSHSSL
jgi:hypothetical protein